MATTRALVQWGADLEKPSSTGLTPLHYAAVHGHCPSMATLLHAKADPHRRCCFLGAYLHTPLTIAARQGHAEAVRLLLAQQAFIESRTGGTDEHTGLTALHLAAMQSHPAAVAALVAARADVNVREYASGAHHTPLMYAARNGCAPVVCILIGGKADVNLHDAYGATCLEYLEECTARDENAAAETRFFLEAAGVATPVRFCDLEKTICVFRRADVQGQGLISRTAFLACFERLGMDRPQVEMVLEKVGCTSEVIDYSLVLRFIFSDSRGVAAMQATGSKV